MIPHSAGTTNQTDNALVLPDSQAAVLRETATNIIGFLRGTVPFERIALADSVQLLLSPNGGGGRNVVSRTSLRNLSNWKIRSADNLHDYRLTPPTGMSKLTTQVGKHLNCMEQPLSSSFADLARFPHVGTRLEPPGATSCMQSWNLTLVFDSIKPKPALIAAVYDQWEW